MKREKIVTGLWGTLLAFGLSFGAVACMVTAFDMEVSLAAAAGVLVVAAAICSICFSLPLGAVPFGLGAAVLFGLWRNDSLFNGAEAILNRLSRQYDRAYSWGIVRWSIRTAPEMEPDLLLALCVIGTLVALLTAWSVCRRKTILPGMLISVTMLATCVVVTDTVPDAGWLYLYLLSVSILLITCAVRRTSSQDANRLTAVAAAGAALVLLLVFVLNPTQHYKGKELAGNIAERLRRIPVVDILLDQMGMEEKDTSLSAGRGVDLTVVGKRSNSNAKIMEILVTGSGTSTVYLRSMAYDVYDGKSWTSSGKIMTGLAWPTGLQDRQIVQIKTNFAHQMLYTPYYVQSINLTGTVTGVENKNSLTEYSFNYSPMPDKQYFLSRFPNIPTGMDELVRGNMLLAIQMDSSVRRWADPLCRRILAKADVNGYYHKAQAIGDYVRASAKYDLNTNRMPKRKTDFARWFLEDSDTGYCVHFATAATVLLQAAKIPARYVTGYMVQVEAGVPTVVTTDMAHAWAEYYLPGFGWTVLETTPPDYVSQPLQQTQPEDETATSVPEQTPPAATAPAASAPQTQQPEKGKQQFPWELLWIILIPVAVVGLAEGQYRLRRGLYEKQYARATENQKAVLCWQLLVKLSRLANTTPDKQVYELAQKAAFSQHKLTEQELRQLEDAVKNARSALRKKPFVQWFVYRLVYAV